MPRPLSPDRLTDKEASDFRKWVREQRHRHGLKNNQIADHLNEVDHKVENALKSDRPLLSKMASRLLIAMLELCDNAPTQILMADWYVSYQESLVGPRILVPSDQIKPLAKYIERELKKKPGIRESTLAMIVKSVENALHRDGAKMSKYWRRKAATDFGMAAAEQRYLPKSRKKPSHNPVLDIDLQVIWKILGFIEATSLGEK